MLEFFKQLFNKNSHSVLEKEKEGQPAQQRVLPPGWPPMETPPADLPDAGTIDEGRV